jgi:hypothetical protein
VIHGLRERRGSKILFGEKFGNLRLTDSHPHQNQINEQSFHERILATIRPSVLKTLKRVKACQTMREIYRVS